MMKVVVMMVVVVMMMVMEPNIVVWIRADCLNVCILLVDSSVQS